MTEQINNPQKSARLVVLISGNGSNLQAIIDACHNNILPAEIVGVISNKAEAFGLERAKKSGIKAIVKTKSAAITREEYDEDLANTINELKPDWIVLAGWLRLLSKSFIQHFPNKIVNLHPALPGMFPGLDAIEKAFNAYQNKEIAHTGVMIHLVSDESVDAGPLLAQEIVAILPNDSLETLTERTHAVERKLLVNTLINLLNAEDDIST